MKIYTVCLSARSWKGVSEDVSAPNARSAAETVIKKHFGERAFHQHAVNGQEPTLESDRVWKWGDLMESTNYRIRSNVGLDVRLTDDV